MWQKYFQVAVYILMPPYSLLYLKNQGRIQDFLIGSSNLQSGVWFDNFT